MTLHWWQHWFWITGPAGRRRGVALLLVLVCFHTWSYGCCLAWGRRPQRVAPSASAEQHWLLPVAAGPRRLLGFAGPPFRDDTAPSQTDTEYLTVPTPRASGAREPKAIGVPVATSPSYTLATSSASAATSVAEIVEELTPSPTPAPEAVDVGDHVTWSTPASTVSSPSSAVVETGTPEGAMSSGEMANDEPEQARDPASTSASSAATERADPAEAAGSSMFTSPSSTPGGGSGVSPTVAILNASRSRDLVPALHPGLSPAQGPTTAAPSPSAAPESSSEPSSEPSSPPSEHSSPASISEPPNSHRSAAPLAASTSNSGRHHHPSAQGPHQGHHQGPGAMSLSAGGGLDAGSITGIVLGIVVFAGLVGTVSFVLYRRRYLNKPQTLNDKCSNPDSSGYIDDSTFRENSEEMYSLDNDSFLNSLEAMTIQNYWTDTVKHTKL